MKEMPSMLVNAHTIALSSRPARSPCTSTNLSVMLNAMSMNVGRLGWRAICSRCVGVRREYVPCRNPIALASSSVIESETSTPFSSAALRTCTQLTESNTHRTCHIHPSNMVYHIHLLSHAPIKHDVSHPFAIKCSSSRPIIVHPLK
jgi:hypothetical protein